MGARQKEAELHHRVAIFERGVLQGVQLVRHVRTADVHLDKQCINLKPTLYGPKSGMDKWTVEEKNENKQEIFTLKLSCQ